MFCDQCGAQLQAGDARCGRCGKIVLGLVELRRSRVRDHVRLVGILWMAYSALHVVAGVAVLIVAQVIFGRVNGVIHIPNGPPPEVTVWLRPLLCAIGWLILAKAAAGFFAGWGLLQREEWARVVALVVGFIALLNVPIGTVLGIYTLWVLLPTQSDDEYKALARAA
jgi:hypothetical protein